jgi:hypothetical protein
VLRDKKVVGVFVRFRALPQHCFVNTGCYRRKSIGESCAKSCHIEEFALANRIYSIKADEF